MSTKQERQLVVEKSERILDRQSINKWIDEGRFLGYKREGKNRLIGFQKPFLS